MDPRVMTGAGQVRNAMSVVRPVGFAGDIFVEIDQDCVVVTEVRTLEAHGVNDVALRAKIKPEDDGTWTLYVRFNDEWDLHLDIGTHVSLDDIILELTEDLSEFFWG